MTHSVYPCHLPKRSHALKGFDIEPQASQVWGSFILRAASVGGLFISGKVSDVAVWHKADIKPRPLFCRYGVQSRRAADMTKSTLSTQPDRSPHCTIPAAAFPAPRVTPIR
jgi:hypothetical protein